MGTGLSDAERATPPPVGSVITFRYQELSDGGVPRFPSFVRVCKLADTEAAQRDADKLTAEKTGKGYVETGT